VKLTLVILRCPAKPGLEGYIFGHLASIDLVVPTRCRAAEKGDERARPYAINFRPDPGRTRVIRQKNY
jgi:hypothetical protein